ncbi:hypothetical protein DFH06DRAFT_1121378 [Mycena polygramma]|nr:hypothetical protein DFH06DRAFT_1121378 [Mycena polygramma]
MAPLPGSKDELAQPNPDWPKDLLPEHLNGRLYPVPDLLPNLGDMWYQRGLHWRERLDTGWYTGIALAIRVLKGSCKRFGFDGRSTARREWNRLKWDELESLAERQEDKISITEQPYDESGSSPQQDESYSSTRGCEPNEQIFYKVLQHSVEFHNGGEHPRDARG